jgi:two-component system nitrogen regulation sensor histidine kinase GlnL
MRRMMDIPAELLATARRGESVAERVLDTLPLAVIALDVSGAISYLNPAAELLLGRSISYLKGRAFNDLIDGDGPLADFVARARTRQAMVSGRTLRLSGPGILPQNVSVSVAPDGETGGLVLALSPAQRRAIHDPIGPDAASLSGLARMLAHEINNPLAGVIGASQLLMRKAQPDQLELLGLIREESERIKRLVRRFAEFETFSTPALKPLNIHEVLRGVEALTHSTFGSAVVLSTQYDPSLPEVLGDSDHLNKAIFNLVKNAVEARSNPQRPARVSLSTSYRSGVRIMAGRPARGAIAILIEDDGPGIPEHARERIFDPFFTTKSSGVGVGLAVVSDIIGAHGGTIELETGTDTTRFLLQLAIPDIEATPNE